MGERKTAACLAVGSELLGDRRLDSNSLAITRALARYGVVVEEKRVVGDSVERMADEIRDLLSQFDLVVVTGGLGPTADDVTRDAVARALDRSIEPDPEVEGWIRARYSDLGRKMPPICTVMARVVDGSRALRNDRGSAPGLMVEEDDHLLAVFPGVPWEMEEMLERDLLPLVAGWNPGWERVTRTLLLGGVVESDTEEEIRHLYDRFGRENITILASDGVLRLVLSAEGDEEAARSRVDTMDAAFREVLGMTSRASTSMVWRMWCSRAFAAGARPWQWRSRAPEVWSAPVSPTCRAPRKFSSAAQSPTPTTPRRISSGCRTSFLSSTGRSRRRSPGRWPSGFASVFRPTGASASPALPARPGAASKNRSALSTGRWPVPRVWKRGIGSFSETGRSSVSGASTPPSISYGAS